MSETCAMCGKISDSERDGSPPLGWCSDRVDSREGSRLRWVCQECTRYYVRSIEAKLDSSWW